MARGRRRVPAERIDERSFHDWLVRRLPAARQGRLPLGDDAADLAPPPGQLAIVTTDSLVEGTHFLPASPPGLVGAAATNVSLSDLAAKGAEPAGILLAVLVPPGTRARWAQEVVEGAERAARRAGAHVIGGDTKPSPVRAVVSTAIGWGEAGLLAPRSGARVGDVLVTTGTVGTGGAAAQALARHGARSAVLSRLLTVTPRLSAGRALGRFAHAMVDTSDGIAEAARLLASFSRVRIVLDERRLPFAPALDRLGSAQRRATAYFGGDYELLAAVPRERLAAARRSVRATRTPLTIVGEVERGRGTFLATDDGLLPMPEAGWQPFRR